MNQNTSYYTVYYLVYTDIGLYFFYRSHTRYKINGFEKKSRHYVNSLSLIL